MFMFGHFRDFVRNHLLNIKRGSKVRQERKALKNWKNLLFVAHIRLTCLVPSAGICTYTPGLRRLLHAALLSEDTCKHFADTKASRRGFHVVCNLSTLHSVQKHFAASTLGYGVFNGFPS